MAEPSGVRETARERRGNTETMRHWIQSGELSAQKLGNQLFIKRTDLEAFLKDTNNQKTDRFTECAVALQERIRAKTGVEFDVSALIEQSRQRHIHEW